MSLSFRLGGAHVDNVPGNTSQYLHNTVCNYNLFFLSIFSKWGITPSGGPLSLYNISYRKNMGLRDAFDYLSYIM